MADLGYNNTTAASEGAYDSLCLACYDDTDGTGGTTSAIYAYCRNTNVTTAGVISVAIYAHTTDDSGRPGARLAAAASISVPANSDWGWRSTSYAVSLSASTRYWIGHCETTNPSGLGIKYESSGGADRQNYLSASALPDPWTNGTKNTTRWCIYAAYGPAGLSIPVAMLQSRTHLPFGGL